MRRSPLRTTFALAAAALAVVACDRSPSGLDSEVEIAEIIIAERGTRNAVAYSHHDHWHGVLRLELGDAAEYTIYFLDEPMGVADHSLPDSSLWIELPSEGGYALQGVVEDGAVATWTGGAGDGRLSALSEGGTHVSFVVLKGGTTIYQAPPLGLAVTP
ncbi:hypothetical protein WI460_12115 [Gemmatimonadota bacterium Y43]|uniref:hypothetical protein n=1 Tax=Gaopeijia maritima TaxID=3119007 RepID=UPI00328793C9